MNPESLRNPVQPTTLSLGQLPLAILEGCQHIPKSFFLYGSKGFFEHPLKHVEIALPMADPRTLRGSFPSIHSILLREHFVVSHAIQHVLSDVPSLLEGEKNVDRIPTFSLRKGNDQSYARLVMANPSGFHFELCIRNQGVHHPASSSSGHRRVTFSNTRNAIGGVARPLSTFSSRRRSSRTSFAT
jgi:hypothetical protein